MTSISTSTPLKQGHLAWWQLTILGMGFTTGTGFFLGTSIAIVRAGVAVLITFAVAALATYFVYHALAQMIAAAPETGSFRTYAKQAFGRWAGFSNGWLYWTSEVLVLGSTLTALGLFTQYWIPSVPLWMLSGGYALISLLIVGSGIRGFEKVESILSIVKIAAIVVFIGIGVWVVSGVYRHTVSPNVAAMLRVTSFFPTIRGTQMLGLWTSLIYGLYAFGGIEVMGFMGAHLTRPKDAPKAGKVMLIVLSALFLTTIAFLLLMVPNTKFSAQQSPFVTVLTYYGFSVLLHLFNSVFIIAAFSVLIASVYSVTLMLSTLADDGDAPRLFAQPKEKRQSGKLSIIALALTTLCMGFSVLLALLLPKQIYEHLITAGGIMLMYTWLFILVTYRKLQTPTRWNAIKIYVAGFVILLSIVGTCLHASSRIGFFVSLLILSIIFFFTWLRGKKWATSSLPHA